VILKRRGYMLLAVERATRLKQQALTFTLTLTVTSNPNPYHFNTDRVL